MFFGSFAYSLDNKGRLVVPAKFRLATDDTLYALRGHEKCLSLFPVAAFEKLQDRIGRLDYNQKAARDYIRVMLGSTIEMTIDSHGRIQIPVTTCKQYGLEGLVRIIGVGDHIEVWSEDAWKQYEQAADASFEATAESLKD